MGEVRKVAQAFYDAFAAGDFSAATALFADDCVTVMPGGTVDNAGHEAVGRAFRDAFPDSRMEVVRAVESGEEVHISGRFKGTHTGDLIGPSGTVPASGKPLDLAFSDYFRVANGKIVTHEVIFDQMSLLGQVGALPTS